MDAKICRQYMRHLCRPGLFRVSRIEIDNITSKWIREKKNIYDFMEPVIHKKDYIWLYDLCLVKNHRLELCSCSHEQFCYISREMLEAYKNNKRT